MIQALVVICLGFFFFMIGSFIIGSFYTSHINEQKRKKIAKRNGKR